MFSITDYVSAVQIFLTGLPEVLMRLEKSPQKTKIKPKALLILLWQRT